MVNAHKDEIIKMHKEGKTAKQIADYFGFSRSFISKKLREWGVKKEIDYVDIDKLSSLYKKLNNASEAARIIGIDEKRAHRLLIKGGFIKPKNINIKKGPFQKCSEEIIKKYQAGESSDKIAKDIGCSGYTVLKILRNAGVVRSKQTNVLKDHKEEIFRLYNEEELTQAEIAKRFGVSTSSISLFLRVNKTNG